MQASNARPRHIKNLKVKLGHGGTLDPLATGVLTVGVGRGTKCLGRFLECTKSYECVVLFGAATDSYDAVGKVVSRAEYAHVTKELVEEKLKGFMGKIMQKPSIFSALKVDGKKMYEYAREGGDIPEVAARPVEVEALDLVEWLEPGTHEYKWPDEEVDSTEKVGAEKLMGIRKQDAEIEASRGKKRLRSRSPGDKLVTNEDLHAKKPKTDGEPVMSGALPVEDPIPTEDVSSAQNASTVEEAAAATSAAVPAENIISADAHTELARATSPAVTKDRPSPPAARLRMTVTSGFYVRSLCHDLGLACNSLGFMSSLIRTRQGDYSLDKNVLEYSDLEAGPEVWEPKVRAYLEEFMEKEGWEAVKVEDEEEWQAKLKERKDERKEGDRERSYRGGGGKGGGKYGRKWQKR